MLPGLFIHHSGTANFYYATRIKVESALHLYGNDINMLIVPDMEKERAIKESCVKEVVSYSEIGYHERLKEFRDSKKALVESLKCYLKQLKTDKILIPHNFPAYLAFGLSKAFEVEIVENPFSKLRAVKRKEEIAKIRETCSAILEAFEFLKGIVRKGKKCEELRNAVELFLFERGFLAEDTILASGKLTAFPHFKGEGDVEEHVVVDIFPKSRTHGYYGDFTRTILIEPEKEIEEMLEAVIEAKQKGIEVIREGVKARDVHGTVCDVLESYGYKTLRSKSSEGFIHSTGHGVGLEVHEEPRIFENDDVLKAGMVFTVEPGLYYLKWGGVRVEDTVVVTKRGCEVLTPYPDRVRL
ncbi:M24 family metallopeptidase [Archaeoglobus veneficus]|uniref:Peptidase M24 n=1 Tax=Archaeoglobus veneficus (strain DSM 11195 / SNP6) TaxID=693661 RepID=F2KRD7_ARCVS|nr:Xaa-Pro peptidase family protein [Archaeoglobus veneficus]AEA47871.1 peptidase M24 [Archaeoglobus veneficus SNP6]